MSRPTVISKRSTNHAYDLQLESVARVSRFPIVETGIHIANNVYERIKRSNSLMGWGLDTAEHSLALATARIADQLHLPITMVDQLLCKGIDIFEQRVPAVHLPPHLMYWNTREYVNNKFVKPVLIRADSVKQIATERLNGAIDVADQYVDKYLPSDDPSDQSCRSSNKPPDCASDCTDSGQQQSTIEHGARFSRKLQRRLTRRTFAEARALKEQGTECIHVLLYVVELLATDPKLALRKARELWASLSGAEPENQARPTNLEQLLVLFTRETARRIVHLVNASASLASRTPRKIGRSLLGLSHRLMLLSERALKVTNQLIYRLLVLLSYPYPDNKPNDNPYLSLVAKINIVPLPTKLNGSIIEEVEELEEIEERQNFKNNHRHNYLRPPKDSHSDGTSTYNADSLLPHLKAKRPSFYNNNYNYNYNHNNHNHNNHNHNNHNNHNKT